MAMKFIRGLIYPNPNTNGTGLYWRLKWIYEFWGFCVNGGASTTVPGGFAANNGIIFPTNFTDGTSLLASGVDGSTSVVTGDNFDGECIFTSPSATFTTDMIGKALVIWKPNSDSSEDSIYLITTVLNSNQIVFNANTGGTPNPSTKHPTMSARTGINYRVVDMFAGFNAAAAYGFGLVLNFDADSINSGQGNIDGHSQVFLGSFGTTSGAGTPWMNYFAYSLGGSGSWSGNSQLVQSISNTAPNVVTTSAPHGLTTGQTVNITGVTGKVSANGHWLITVLSSTTFSLNESVTGSNYISGGTIYNGFQNDGYANVNYVDLSSGAAYTGGQTCINMVADKTFLIAHVRELDLFQNGPRLSLHIEVPQRLYDEGQDKHPLAILVDYTSGGSLNTSQTNRSYGGGFTMCGHDSDPGSPSGRRIRPYRTLVKAIRGDGTPDVFGQNLSDYRVGYNTAAGTVPMSDGLLSVVGVNNQFQFARVRLRTVKFTGTHVPPHHRLGTNGEFIQLQNGICWPWDNTIIPFQLLLFGSG